MRRLVVMGASGMLGGAVLEEAEKRSLNPVALTSADQDLRKCLAPGWWLIHDDDVVINCAGLIRSLISDYPAAQVIHVNGVAPHEIAQRCWRLLQVSTDCVFDGAFLKSRTESSSPSPQDLYGVSKLAGEVTYGHHLTVRTSFIGVSPKGLGLLSWFLRQRKGARLAGYNQLWSGYYVKELAPILVDLALDQRVTGLQHLRGHPTSKYQLLAELARCVRPDIVVQRDLHFRGDYVLYSERPYQGDRHTLDIKETVEMIAADLRADP